MDQVRHDVAVGRRPLERYLHDHLGRAQKAIALARASFEVNQGSAYAAPLEQLVKHLESDLGQLRTVLSALVYLEHAPVKEGVVWITDKIRRFSPATRSNPSSDRRTMEFEELHLALGSQVHLWKTLERMKARERSLARFDFSSRVKSAQQHEKEILRLLDEALTEWASVL